VNRLKSLRSRLLSAALVWVICATIAGSWALSYAFRTTAQDAFDARLTSLLSVLIGLADIGPDGALKIDRDIGDPHFETIYSGWYWIASDAQGVRLRSRSLWDSDLPMRALPVSASPSYWNAQDTLGREIRIAAQSVLLPGSATPVTFVVSGDLDALHSDARRFDWVLRTALSTLSIGLAIAVLAQVIFGLRPLNRLTRDIEAVRSGRADTVAPSGTAEIDALIAELNSLIQHNRGLIERARASASDLAHALKTPLAVMQSIHHDDANAALEQREQIAAMERIITRHLARAATAGPGRHAAVPIAPIVDEIARGLERIHADRNLELLKEIPGDLVYAADREDLEEMIGNLVENAYKWARSRIRISVQSDASALSLIVEDDGPGIEDQHAEQVTERGTRLDESTPGTGLGLSIVTDIANIYSGNLRLARARLGGLRAELTLPLGRPSPARPIGFDLSPDHQIGSGPLPRSPGEG
jgi:signal transduction histidine kinase